MKNSTETVFEPREETDEVLSVDSLSVEFSTGRGPLKALRDVSFDVHEGELFGIAGESGSGKSTLALAILQYLSDNGEITQGDIYYKGTSLTGLSKKQITSLRGNEIAHIPQDPHKSLNPSLRVGRQIAETIVTHQDVSKSEAKSRTIEVLREVNISDPEYNYDRYPHELSGGMKQRILIAMALACNPSLLILDEPTTGLDVTTQTKILDLVNDLKQEYNTSIILITHDLGVIAETTDRMMILYAGEIMERGSVEEIFKDSANPYTQGLLTSIPDVDAKKELKPIPGKIPDLTDVPDGCIFADRCEFAEDACRSGPIAEESVSDGEHYTRCRRWETVMENPIQQGELSKQVDDPQSLETLVDLDDVKKHFGEPGFFDRLLGNTERVRAVDGVSFDVKESESVGLVGESGCGKSTLGQTILRLIDITDGTVTFRGEDIHELEGSDLKEFRSEAQVVFQNPDSSLNPKKNIGEIIERPLKLFTDKDKDERREKVEELLNSVELGPDFVSRNPHELSGGEKQRVAIARAFAANPAFVVLDEPVSALDVSVQASIVNLLEGLRREYGTSFLFISHDLSVVNHISDRIAVMYLGKIAEVGTSEEIFQPPYHPYTRALLSSVPSTDPTEKSSPIHLEGDVPSARDTPNGCPFHTRCPQKIGDICENETPSLETVEGSDGGSHRIACHLDESEMARENLD